MPFKERVKALRERARSERGFTIFELVTAVTLSGVVSLATITILITVTGNVGRSQANTAIGAQTESVLTNFSRNIRGASVFEAFSTQSALFITENGSKCERHLYQFVSDDTNPGRMALRHTITAVDLPSGAGCSSVTDRLRSGAITPQNDSIELRSLDPSSKFRIYASTGQEIPPLGATAYLVDGDLPNCTIASVDLNLVNVLTTSRGASVKQDNTARVALLNNVRALTC